MKIAYASDLHLEFLLEHHPQHKVIEPTQADVLVLAGDIHEGSFAAGSFHDWSGPIVYVAGNHEFYRRQYQTVREELAAGITTRRRRLEENELVQLAVENGWPIGTDEYYRHEYQVVREEASAQFHYLENSEWIHQDVRFLGATLWSDYMLYNDAATAISKASVAMNDHKTIYWEDRLFTPADALALHQESRTWLERKIAEPFAGKTVVVTHHCPSRYSVAAQYGDNPLNAAFASDLSHLMGEDRVALWIHGHTHTSFDYTLRGTRVVCNPCGYPRNRWVTDPGGLVFENPDFDRRLVVEI